MVCWVAELELKTTQFEAMGEHRNEGSYHGQEVYSPWHVDLRGICKDVTDEAFV